MRKLYPQRRANVSHLQYLNILNFLDKISIPTEAEPVTPARTFVEQLNLPGGSVKLPHSLSKPL